MPNTILKGAFKFVNSGFYVSPVTDKPLLAQNLKRARQIAGLTQKQVAREFSWTDVTISNHERGETTPDEAQLKQYATLYGVSIRDLRYAADVRTAMAETRGAAAEVEAHNHAMAVREALQSYGWEPNPTLRNAVPERVYEVAIGYCRRLVAAGLPPDEIEEAERILVDPAYAKLNRKAKRELTEDEQIQIIDATWGVMQEVLSWKGVRA